MLKKILIVAAALVALMAGPAAAQYGPNVSGTVSNPNPQPGETVTVEGTCELADEVGVSIVGEADLGTIPVVDGSYSGPVTIPSDLAPGEYTLRITCGTEVLDLTINVGGSRSTGPLADTGSDNTGLLIKLGGGLILVGGAVALVATKRRGAATA